MLPSRVRQCIFCGILVSAMQVAHGVRKIRSAPTPREGAGKAALHAGQALKVSEENLGLRPDSLPPAKEILDGMANSTKPDGKRPTGVDVAVGLIEAIATLDFNAEPEEMGEQLAGLGVAIIGTALGLANPVLGACFGLFAGLFQPDPNERLLQEVLEMTEKMIEGALIDFKHNMSMEYIDGLLYQIRRASQAKDWQDIKSKMFFLVPSLFGKCSSSPGSSECIKWQTETGGAKALIFEITFTSLMVSVATEMKRIGEEESFVALTDTLDELTDRLQEHKDRFSSWREEQARVQCLCERTALGDPIYWDEQEQSCDCSSIRRRRRRGWGRRRYYIAKPFARLHDRYTGKTQFGPGWSVRYPAVLRYHEKDLETIRNDMVPFQTRIDALQKAVEAMVHVDAGAAGVTRRDSPE